MNFILKKITIQTATLCEGDGLFTFVRCFHSIFSLGVYNAFYESGDVLV